MHKIGIFKLRANSVYVDNLVNLRLTIYICTSIRVLWSQAHCVPRHIRIILVKTLLLPILIYRDVVFCNLEAALKTPYLNWYLLNVCATLLDWDDWIEYRPFQTNFLDGTSLEMLITEYVFPFIDCLSLVQLFIYT